MDLTCFLSQPNLYAVSFHSRIHTHLRRVGSCQDVIPLHCECVLVVVGSSFATPRWVAPDWLGTGLFIHEGNTHFRSKSEEFVVASRVGLGYGSVCFYPASQRSTFELVDRDRLSSMWSGSVQLTGYGLDWCHSAFPPLHYVTNSRN